PTEELRNSFRFKHYVMLSKIYKHKNPEQKRKRSDDSEEAIVYVKPEDEIFHKMKNYRSMGLIMAVEADKIPTFRQELGV
ncbi:protein BCCIP, partial [Trifolium pratense]